MGIQLREQRGTIKQFIQCQLNTTSFTDRNLCSAGLHTHGRRWARALESWVCECSGHSKGICRAPGMLLWKGVDSVDTRPIPPFLLKQDSWWLPSGKPGPLDPHALCAGFWAWQWEAKDQQKLEPGGTWIITVKAREHLAPALSFCRCPNPVPRGVWGLARSYTDSNQQGQGHKIHCLWFWIKMVSFFLRSRAFHPIWNSFPPSALLWESPAHIQTTSLMSFSS